MKPWIHRPHVRHALDHQAGGDEQSARQRDLEDDERLTDLADPEARRAARFVLENLIDVGARRLDTPGSRPETASSEVRRAIVNNSTGGCSRMSMKNGICVTVIARLNIATPKYATTIPKTVASDRQHQRFREELSDDRRARRAERGANPDFLRAVRGAVEQQVRDVGAGDQQHEEHRAEHRVEQLPRLACRCSCR